MKKSTLLACAVALFSTASINAQSAPTPAPAPIDHSYKPLTLKLNEDGSKYLRFITWHQFWISHTWNNPGTVDVNGNAKETSTDIALRRSRILLYAQISPRFLILSHFGINNQSFLSGGGNGQGATGLDGKKPQLFIHDAWTEYEILKDKLSIGAGLHYWNGVSRIASASTLNFAGLDAPIFNWYNIEQSDQFARQFGIYAKGQIGKIDYRVSVNKPFLIGQKAGAPVSGANATTMGSYLPISNSTDIAAPIKTENWATQGYVAYQFLDKESNKLPFYVGSHLGSKKVFNIGAGWYHHGGVMGTLDSTQVHTGGTVTDTVFTFKSYSQTHFGVDAYLDMPIGSGDKKGCLHAYALYQNMNFGPNYVRNIGILNTHPTATGSTAGLAGGGNAQPTLGTGSIVYTELGYALPKFSNGHQIMPYVNTTYKNFSGLKDPSLQFDFGVNYFVSGHNAKITLQYSTRPTYKTDKTLDGSKGQLTLQTHIFL